MNKKEIKFDLATRIVEHLVDPSRTLPHGHQPYIWTTRLDERDLADVEIMVKNASNYNVRVLAKDYSYRWSIVENT